MFLFGGGGVLQRGGHPEKQGTTHLRGLVWLTWLTLVLV